MALIMLSGCHDRIGSQVDEAFEAYQSGMSSKGYEIIQQLIAESDQCDTYDKANIGIAAMTLGAEYENKELIADGYRIAKTAMREDLKKCNMVISMEDYDYTGSYSQVIQALYDIYKDMKLKEDVVGSWITEYNNYLWDEQQRFREKLSLYNDGTFREAIAADFSGELSDYVLKAKGNITIAGVWTMEDGTITLRYKMSTLKTELPKKDFKITLSNQAFYGDFISSAFNAVLMEDEVYKEVSQKVHEEFDELYQQKEFSYAVSFEDGEMLFRNYRQTISYSPSSN